MANQASNVILLENSARAERDLVSELFHQINRIIPQDQQVKTVPPKCLVRDAVQLMKQHSYSQLPVVRDGHVLGVFSYRSLAVNVTAPLEQWIKQKVAPGDLCVEEFMEKFNIVRVTEEMSSVFDDMERDNGVLIGTPENLIAILTPIDFLRYFYGIANAFVLISEIELALRTLIHISLKTTDQIAQAATRCLKSAYPPPRQIPTELEDMTFDNYQMIISHGDLWNTFEPAFGGNRIRTSARLIQIREIRNDILHFRRKSTLEDHDTLANHRNWLLGRIKQYEIQRAREAKS